MAFPNENGRQYANSYTMEEAETVDKAKRTHRETTQSAQRALKVEPCLSSEILTAETRTSAPMAGEDNTE